MKEEATMSFLTKIGLAVASATVVGGGSMVLKANTDNATQEVRLQRVEAALQKVDRLSDKLDTTNTNLLILNERMEARLDVPRK